MTVDRQDLPAPPIGDLLAAELRELAPVATRRPWRDVAAVTAAAATSIAVLVVTLAVRRDLDALPRAWLIGYGGAWLAGFALLAWLSLVPRAGAVVPRWLPAAVGAGLAAVGFVAAGLTFDRTTALSLVYAPTTANHLLRAAACAGLGTITALVPMLLGARLLRGAVPVGGAAIGSGLGAACGAAGGFLLHLHCPITHPIHLGVGHGGAVLICALLGALLVPVLARIR